MVNFDPRTPHFAIVILDNILICCGHPDYEIPDITFNFWYRLSEELYQKNEETLNNIFRPFIERLINSLCRHCQMEPDYDGLLEEGEDFTGNFLPHLKALDNDHLNLHWQFFQFAPAFLNNSPFPHPGGLVKTEQTKFLNYGENLAL